MSELTGRAYRIPGEYKRVFEHKLRELVASLRALPEFARDGDTAGEVGEVVLAWRPAATKGAAGRPQAPAQFIRDGLLTRIEYERQFAARGGLDHA